MSVDHGQSSRSHLRLLERTGQVRLICIADTHGRHRELALPRADFLIHAGDFTLLSLPKSQIRDFNDWLGELPHRHKVIIPGNHEFAFEEDPKLRRLITNAVVLIDEGVELGGFRIWGSPVTPLYGGAFGLSRPQDRVRLYTQIPADTDILITHGPPFGILDRPPNRPDHAGDAELREAVDRIKPRVHIFGHVHDAYGIEWREHTVFVNAALCGESGSLDYYPVVFKIPAKAEGR